MVTVEFVEALTGTTVSIQGQRGERIVDLADELDAPVPFSCRSANCGICRVHVTEGFLKLAAASPDERELLQALGSSGAERLACQARINADEGLIRLRVGSFGGV